MAREFVDALGWAGVPKADLNAPYNAGADAVTYTQRFGRRTSTRDAFINPVRRRGNLRVLKYAHVTKVIYIPATAGWTVGAQMTLRK
jgi:choline dehydrogenase-like flavoprotein